MRLQRLIALAVSLVSAALGCDTGPSVRDCPTGTSCRPDGGPVTDRPLQDVRPIDVGDLFTGLMSVEVQPANMTLTVRGQPVNLDFTLVGRYSNGMTRVIPLGAWRSTTTDLGDINAATGRFTANGLVGGTTRIEVSLPREDASTLQAATNLTVQFERETYATPDGGVTPPPSSVTDRFTGTPANDPAQRVTLRYPPASTVMPQNVAPPDVQWEGGAQGDIYRVTLSKPHAQVRGYVTHSGAGFRYDWVVDTAGWRALAESETMAPIRLVVDRAHSGGVAAGAPIEFRLARGSLAGVIYYWDLRNGKILRIVDDSARREDFMPNPPRAPSGRVPASDERCVACHAVSRDGRYMAAEMWEGQGPSTVFDLTRDLSGNPAPTRFAPAYEGARWVYATWNPDSTRLLVNLLGGLELRDPSTGAMLPVRGGSLPTGNSVQPAWSPDGRTVAYVSDYAGPRPVTNPMETDPGPTAFAASNLSSFPVTGTDAFGASRVLVRGSSLASQPEGGNAIAYPSWTPDGRWMSFQHGPFSESDIEPAPGQARRRFAGAVYLVGPDGTNPTRMTLASGGGAEADSFFPNFSPFNQGGYYWILFFSRRDYGNAQAGTRGTGRRQLWVSAVSNNPTPGTDPSSVPYWLPGQDVRNDNVSGFWAPQPCVTRGGSCQVSSECCAGTCGPNPQGQLVCNPPPANMPCRGERERCGATSDCCMGLECAANVCLAPPG
jgi:hypothetical protein